MAGTPRAAPPPKAWLAEPRTLSCRISSGGGFASETKSSPTPQRKAARLVQLDRVDLSRRRGLLALPQSPWCLLVLVPAAQPSGVIDLRVATAVLRTPASAYFEVTRMAVAIAPPW